jgi:hypothetical protein
LKVVLIIAFGLFAWFSYSSFLSGRTEVSAVKETVISPISIDISDSNSFYYRPMGKSNHFDQTGERTVIVSRGKELVLSIETHSTHIKYKNKIFSSMKLYTTQTPVTRVSLPILIKKWFGDDEELKTFAIAILVATLGKGKYPKLLQRNGFEINFDIGCESTEFRYDVLGNGCKPGVSVVLINTQ